MHGKKVRVVTLVVVGMLSAVLLGGCMGQAVEENNQQTASRQYMAAVNQTMEELSDRLEGFNDAVSRDDVVSMRTQAENAFKTLDNLGSIEAPEELSGVQSDYVGGCDTLKQALNSYIDLYTEIETATDEHPFDYATYDSRIKEVRDKYNDGISQLEAADKAASEL